MAGQHRLVNILLADPPAPTSQQAMADEQPLFRITRETLRDGSLIEAEINPLVVLDAGAGVLALAQRAGAAARGVVEITHWPVLLAWNGEGRWALG